MRLIYPKGVLSALFTVIFASIAFSQVTISGTVIDGNALPISGAQVNVMGGQQNTVTEPDGTFAILSNENEGVIEIFDALSGSKQIRFNAKGEESIDLGTITLKGDGVDLAKMVVVGKGIIDLAEDRKTPIAASIISGAEIQDRAVGNVEFPEAMKNTPNVYVTNQSSGFGDGQMFLRGFDQSNTAFLLNGQPINGMEDGNMYWSNWSGIADIANGIQVQRGLGSSKLAISSVGGTINIVTKATEKRQGGFVRLMAGNDSYFKGSIGYNTGLMDNGWGISFMVDHWQGWRKYAEGTAGQGQNYFLSVGKLVGDHNFNFMIFGAPQSHEQNFSKTLDLYEKYGLKYNNNYGFLNGERTTWRKNYYHKPVMNFNWDWNISNETNLSTVLYASLGRGGGTGPYGSSRQSNIFVEESGLVDFDKVVENNEAIAGGIGSYGKAAALRSSVNNHRWFGLVSNLENKLTNELTVNLGADVRFYKGDHFRQLSDLLGLNGWEDSLNRYAGSLDANGQYIVRETFKANPWSSLFDFADRKNRIGYDSSEWINYQGLFGQAEYATNSFSAFFQGAVSNQSYQKEENFRANGEKSKKINRIGYNLKGGASVNLNEENQLFANAGYYSRQPFLDNIFDYNEITQRDADPNMAGFQKVENEIITGLEAGYRFKQGRTTVNINAYYTKWENKFDSGSGRFDKFMFDLTPDEANDPKLRVIEASYRLPDITRIHKGLELDFNSKITSKFKVRGFFTYNDFKYDDKTSITLVRTDNNTVKELGVFSLKNIYVGEAPMVTSGLGTEFEVVKNLSFNVDANYYGKLYGVVDIKRLIDRLNANEAYQAEKLKPYATVDLGLSYTIDFGGKDLKLRANVYNVFNNKYLSRRDNFGYYYGNGTTWNTSIRYEF